MWTTSSFRAERCALLLSLLLPAACATAPVVAPEAPRQGMRVPPEPPRTVAPLDTHLEVESVVIHRAEERPDLVRRIGKLPGGSSPALLIEVRTIQPLGVPGRAAPLAILLDGEPLPRTRMVDSFTVVAPVPQLAPGDHTVKVTRLGAELTTESRKAYVLRVP